MQYVSRNDVVARMFTFQMKESYLYLMWTGGVYNALWSLTRFAGQATP